VAPVEQVVAPEPGPRPDRVAARHILVTWSGAKGAPFGTVRTRREALERIEEARAKLTAGVPFEELAKHYSEDGSAARGGFLGSGQAGTWVPPFEEAVFSLPVGGVSGVVETVFGYHLVRREPLEEIRLMHLVVQYKGTMVQEGGSASHTRTEQHARLRAEEALAALEGGADFATVAERYSDGPMAKRGADLGWFIRGELGPDFDEAAFELEVGQVSGIVHTRFGYYVIQRVE